MMDGISEPDIFNEATSIKNRYNPTDVIYFHLIGISKLSEHIYTSPQKEENYNAYNYLNMVEILWTMIGNVIDDEAKTELEKLKGEYSGDKLTHDQIVKYATGKLHIFMRLLTRSGMWFIREVVDEI